MKAPWVVSVFIGLIPAAVTAQGVEQSREQNIAQIVKLVGLEDQLAQSWKASTTQAQMQLHGMLVQAKDLLSKLTPAQQEEFHKAIDQFTASSLAPLDTSDAAAAWGRFFAADLTDDDLKKIVQSLQTPMGIKELKASTSATTQLAEYMRGKRAEIMDKAIQQYIADLKAIVAESKQPSAAAATAPPNAEPTPPK